MINATLQHFCNHVAAAGRIEARDVAHLSRDILPDGIMERDEADMLIALGRAVTDADGAFGDWLVAAIVDFSVWGERPTGRIERETAAWLRASLTGRDGPSELSARIAIAVVREAQASDESLVAFALDANRRSQGLPAVREQAFPLAA
ncbi:MULTISPECIES: hypothetical protein [Methylobacterium]|uniref:Uncharacterized protein n=1 Tax=Methylobacterium jeotgali TaxID=381630 RepID=A0ABQ4STR6_9HYPH|nr:MULTISPECIES: hypothetical protein [Methylobacterium]PIU04457.1 MAG: hypothetical protein COT56_19940 [Methylobacterium sp. CG09_land_8_20_14_0_10_71_15]PIU13778.1 MAG: hypothetical protein COT28_10250 [Methylobacterium sp. CG08_land_8_20_14_0_20_71_15]GBU17114.1 hypothetical protein AwMethylo_13290 [Methylobacterium sp.]GJE06615.1 hypothetical protein AOPFMNJM_1937 [Methylobacterium jeotgali]